MGLDNILNSLISSRYDIVGRFVMTFKVLMKLPNLLLPSIHVLYEALAQILDLH